MKTSKLTKKELTTLTTRLMKPIMGFLFLACALVSLVFAFGTSDTVQAQTPPPTCGAYTLRGLYIFATHGWNIINGVAQPKAIVEGIDFNGDGTLVSPFATVSINGFIVRSSGTTGVTGVYTVNADCTGTLAFTPGPTFDIFVDPKGGKQLWMIQTGPAVVPPAVFEGTATRVSH